MLVEFLAVITILFAIDKLFFSTETTFEGYELTLDGHIVKYEVSNCDCTYKQFEAEIAKSVLKQIKLSEEELGGCAYTNLKIVEFTAPAAWNVVVEWSSNGEKLLYHDRTSQVEQLDLLRLLQFYVNSTNKGDDFINYVKANMKGKNKEIFIKKLENYIR